MNFDDKACPAPKLLWSRGAEQICRMISASNCAYADTSLKAERSICFSNLCALGLAQLAANANAELYQKSRHRSTSLIFRPIHLITQSPTCGLKWPSRIRPQCGFRRLLMGA